YKSLVEMPNDVFTHHVNWHKDDFAKWVREVLKDTVLARRLKSSRSKIEHVEYVKKRIDELRSLGKRIPHPHSKLSADYSFIKVDKRNLEKSQKRKYSGDFKFKIRGKRLAADTSFITGAHKDQNSASSEIENVISNQRELMNNLKVDVDGKKSMKDGIEELRVNYDDIYRQIVGIKNELDGIKNESVKNRVIQKKRDNDHIGQLKDTINKLRLKEREILMEIKNITKIEEKMISKNEALMDKEKELAKKEGMILKKESHYNILLNKYDDMFKDLQKKLYTDEKKIQTLFTDVHHHHEINKINTHTKPVVNEKNIANGVNNGQNNPMKNMLKKTLNGNDDLLDIMEIDNLIESTKLMINNKKFIDGRKNIDKIKVLIENSKFDNDYKKSVFYQVFELATDIDLGLK
ncbi:hypothetical protein HN415_07925, partial [Candidatus Woesearchaeota archaeon]|nr:hypothetical protein [Candidatus Woesearchaeota archaeon]